MIPHSASRVYARIKQAGNLPSLPEILFRLLTVCDDPDASLTDIGDVISKDPALSLRVLKLVNSAYYGFRHTFRGIDQAVVYLGADTIKNLVVTLSVQQVFRDKPVVDQRLLRTGEFWYESLLCATLAKRIALLTGIGTGEEAYLAGLLHDIGRLVLVATFPDCYRTINGKSGDERRIEALESQSIGVNHCEAGSWLAREWKLNPLVADAILFHHASREQVIEAFPLVRITYLANLLATDLQFQVSLADHYETGKLLLDLDKSDFRSLVEGAVAEVTQIADSLGIKILPPPASPKVEDGNPAEEGEELGRTRIFSEADGDQTFAARPAGDRMVMGSMAAHVKNVSLIATFLEDLVESSTEDEMLAVFEKTMAILFDVESVLFFLKSKDGRFLHARVSPKHALHSMSSGLKLSIEQSASGIVLAYRDMRTGYLRDTDEKAPLSDKQVLALFQAEKALIVPLGVARKPFGAVVAGLPFQMSEPAGEDLRLIKSVAQQLALSLYLQEERSRKAEELNRERMAAVSLTARKFAHEINNPLGIISNYLMAMRLKAPADSEMEKDLSIVDEEIQRIATMVGEMHLLSQMSFSHYQPLDINNVIKDIMQLMKTSFFARPGIGVSFVPGSDLPLINTSKDAIKQILINLLKNAAEAMGMGGRVMVRTKKPVEQGEEVSGGVEIIVADTGPGLPDKVRRNLFQPFITTKEEGHSGLGLSIVQKAVSDIGGRISCQTKPEEGTIFTICIQDANAGRKTL